MRYNVEIRADRQILFSLGGSGFRVAEEMMGQRDCALYPCADIKGD